MARTSVLFSRVPESVQTLETMTTALARHYGTLVVAFGGNPSNLFGSGPDPQIELAVIERLERLTRLHPVNFFWFDVDDCESQFIP